MCTEHSGGGTLQLLVLSLFIDSTTAFFPIEKENILDRNAQMRRHTELETEELDEKVKLRGRIWILLLTEEQVHECILC